MKWFFLSLWDFIVFHTPFLLKRQICDLPADDSFRISDENRLLQKIEPIINNEEMTDAEKITTLKKMIKNYDPLEY